jgi:hypothetical protein
VIAEDDIVYPLVSAGCTATRWCRVVLGVSAVVIAGVSFLYGADKPMLTGL